MLDSLSAPLCPHFKFCVYFILFISMFAYFWFLSCICSGMGGRSRSKLKNLPVLRHPLLWHKMLASTIKCCGRVLKHRVKVQCADLVSAVECLPKDSTTEMRSSLCSYSRLCCWSGLSISAVVFAKSSTTEIRSAFLPKSAAHSSARIPFMEVSFLFLQQCLPKDSTAELFCC